MTLSKTKPKGNSLSGTLAGATYLGTDNQYAVELTDDLSLNVRHQNRTSVGAAMTTGEPVHISIADNAARFLVD